METPQHIVIAGAGIIGLAAALEFRSAGYRVTLLERGRAMEESSWAAAGMLAAADPENEPELRPLAVFSRALYPEFLARVAELSGRPVPFRTTRTWQGHRTRSPGPPPAALPGLRTDRFAFTPVEEASLDSRDLCAALPRAAVAAGAELREHTAVTSVLRRGERLSVRIGNGEALPADHFLLAAGAWSGQVRIPGAPKLPIAPRKGQIIEVTLPEPALLTVIRTPELYLVPRGDGRIVIGATVEDAGFDRGIDEEAGYRLWQAAGALWPPILAARITARWTGLRPGFAPGSGDELPLIGSVGERLWVATGHYRNGILLAPGTARLLRRLMDGEPPPFSRFFAPQRFALNSLDHSA